MPPIGDLHINITLWASVCQSVEELSQLVHLERLFSFATSSTVSDSRIKQSAPSMSSFYHCVSRGVHTLLGVVPLQTEDKTPWYQAAVVFRGPRLKQTLFVSFSVFVSCLCGIPQIIVIVPARMSSACPCAALSKDLSK